MRMIPGSQFDAKLPNGRAVPAAPVLWARVLARTGARLSAAPRYPIRLHPNEWQSGAAIWIVDTVGERKTVQQCIEALAKTTFQGNEFKMLSACDNATAEPVTKEYSSGYGRIMGYLMNAC